MVGSLRVPMHLRVVVPLGRPLDTILAEYDSELRRRIRRLLERGFRTERIEDPDTIRHISKEMIDAFASARHAEHATHVPLEAVMRIARAGRLELLYCAGEAIGAHLGYGYVLDGKRVWTTLRFGYPERIFRNAKALADANTMNVHCALVHALAEGYDAYDIGLSLARPDGGLLEFKRRRQGLLSAFDTDFMHVRLPREGADRLLFESPIFSVDKDAIDLHVGCGGDEDALVARFKGLRFKGLRAVRLHGQASERIRDAIAELYRDRGGTEITVEP